MPWALIVLHDIPGACLGHLDGFLSWLKGEGYGIRREFPDDCLPLREGRIDPTMVSPDAPA